jgi:hypothetical protein
MNRLVGGILRNEARTMSDTKKPLWAQSPILMAMFRENEASIAALLRPLVEISKGYDAFINEQLRPFIGALEFVDTQAILRSSIASLQRTSFGDFAAKIKAIDEVQPPFIGQWPVRPRIAELPVKPKRKIGFHS